MRSVLGAAVAPPELSGPPRDAGGGAQLNNKATSSGTDSVSSDRPLIVIRITLFILQTYIAESPSSTRAGTRPRRNALCSQAAAGHKSPPYLVIVLFPHSLSE